jgi:hypothetical protein
MSGEEVIMSMSVFQILKSVCVWGGALVALGEWMKTQPDPTMQTIGAALVSIGTFMAILGGRNAIAKNGLGK